MFKNSSIKDDLPIITDEQKLIHYIIKNFNIRTIMAKIMFT